ncbi:MAG: PAS domain S-box protein [Spirochaetae bacterium HGW-Spirochaetae-8]|nr:MAG: PAS domain S-box protein [Spirochaetae bacterium HGW-Spirochaetae-8]
MSAEINNSVHRQEVLRELITRLHAGEPLDDVKALFAQEFEGVGADEIAAAEKALMESGVKVEEIQSLCDVHASLFKGSIAEIHGEKNKTKDEGHPTWLLKEENRGIERLLATRLDVHADQLTQGDPRALALVQEDLELLWQIDRHYAKKEYLWFPIMERYGITAPPKVMWGVDDEIRGKVKALRAEVQELGAARPSPQAINVFLRNIASVREQIVEMISKEENILIPMVSEVFFSPDWRQIADGTTELGYCLLEGHATWKPEDRAHTATLSTAMMSGGVVTLPTGTFTPEILTAVLNTLPVDITFVDKNDEVQYFSQSSERVFARTTAIIGRKVINCHPPASMHVVEKILNDFKAGRKDMEEFYIHMKDLYIHIRYYAVRDAAGEYLGTLEVTQNIAPLQKISGDKRLLSE